jgi:hypothetical protein
MEDTITRVINDVFGRLDGPLHFRFFLQPAMAIFFAIRDGLRDSREGRPAYFWSIFTEPHLRGDLIRDGWKSISKVFIIAVILDFIYQLIVLRWFYPFETLLVAVLLALVPYLLVRGPVNRIKRSSRRSTASQKQTVTTETANPNTISPRKP